MIGDRDRVTGHGRRGFPLSVPSGSPVVAVVGQAVMTAIRGKFKGADIAAHDQRPDLKALFLEQLDRELARLFERHQGPLRVAVASDHATLSESGQHAADPLPVLIWGEGIDSDGVEVFDEQSSGAGRLQRFPLQMLLGRLFKLN